MIDEKKKEEAAFESLKKDIDVLRHSIGNAYIEGFHAGINWFLDNLWHDASERMAFDRRIFIEYNDKSYVVISLRGENDRDNIPLKNKITRWFYIDDLLKEAK